MCHKVIRVNKLNKRFQKQMVLKEISFEVAKGECLALIGPNGAGKTVLITCLLGEYLPSGGDISLLGMPAHSSALKQQVGAVFQESPLKQKLTVQELIRFQQAIYPNPLGSEEIDEILGFSPEQKRQLVSKLSGGQRRFLDVVLMLIGQPELIFLDEPTAAMDTSTRQRFWALIDQLKTAGKTIVYSSHYIEEVEHTADRILVLNQGKLLRDTTPYLLRSEKK